jgi:hypothetical protein
MSNNQKEINRLNFENIIGILCLIYFQEKQTSFTGSPAL